MAISVLLVDDHAGFRARARAMLERDGFAVCGEAADGAAALAAARAHPAPEVVLLDVGLPDMSGLEVARRLAGTSPDIRVVLTSTHDAGDFARLAASAGACGFLAKVDLSGPALAAVLGPG
jgi:DNA-binding NarL/FixJ family response regulator